MPDIKLLNIDCGNYLKECEEGLFDLILQDTPFAVTQNSWDTEIDLNVLWPLWIRSGKENCQFIFFGTQPFVSRLIMSNLKMFKYDWIWKKTDSTNFLNAKHQPLRIHEHIIVFYKKSNYHPQGLKRFELLRKDASKKTTDNYGETKGEQYKQDFTNYPESVINFNSHVKTIHPTQKPVDLYRYLIRTYSNIGDTVFDGYSGSGTLALACYQENRNCVCCEIDKGYYEAGVKRYNEAIKQQTLFGY